jgi:uncharacterized protein (TIGR02246 family)
VAPVSAQVPEGARAEVEAAFGRWAAALATRDPATVTALFAPGGVLAPTVSNEVRTTPQRIEAYFVDFLKLAPRPTINQRTIVMLDANTAVEAGVWTFDLTRDGQPSWVTARYSFVWEKTGAGWQIQLLHSSLMPEGQTTRPPAMSPPPMP